MTNETPIHVVEFILNNKDKMTQRAIAKECNITPSAVHYILKGKRRSTVSLIQDKMYFNIDEFKKHYQY